MASKNNANSIMESVIVRSHDICRDHIVEIFDNWVQTGVQENTLSTFGDQILDHLAGLMGDMVKESEQKKQELLENVKVLASQAHKLSRELGITFDQDRFAELPLILLDTELKTQVKKMQAIKQERLDYIEQLLSRENELCEKIGVKPKGFSCELPSEQEIKNFVSYLTEMDIKKNQLADLFKETRKLIIKMMEEIQVTPTLDFEQQVIQDHTNFIYSSSNMSKLKDLKDRLRDQVEQAKKLALEKREVLEALWNCLEESEEHREGFLVLHPGYSLADINALNMEIQRCREKRTENIGKYITKIREEIAKLWELCKFSEQSKHSFRAFYSEDYSEEMLALHEKEEEKLRKYYNANRKIFEFLNEWEIQFDKLKDLDRRANDPDRYHNRGGQLLAEEKERKLVEKKLPKLQSQLQTLVDEYEQVNDQAFLIYGFCLSDFMSHTRDKYEREKENLKLARKQAKDKSAKKTPLSTSKRTPGTTSMRMTPALSRTRMTPGNGTMRATPLAKRKLPYDSSPNTTQSKKQRQITTVEKPKSKTTVIGSKIRRSGRVQNKGNKSHNSSKMKTDSAKKSAKKPVKDETTFSTLEYNNFEEGLDNRDELRSSILPSQKRAGAEMITPIKTPRKPVRRKVLANSTPNGLAGRTARGTPRGPARHPATPRLVAAHDSSVDV